MAFKIDRKSLKKNREKIYKENFKKDKKNADHNKFKRLFFGVGKEFYRITWPTKREIANNFLTIFFVVLVLASLLITVSLVIINYVNGGI